MRADQRDEVRGGGVETRPVVHPVPLGVRPRGGPDLLRREAARQETPRQRGCSRDADAVSSEERDELGLWEAPEEVVGDETDGGGDVAFLLADGEVVLECH